MLAAPSSGDRPPGPQGVKVSGRGIVCSGWAGMGYFLVWYGWWVGKISDCRLVVW